MTLKCKCRLARRRARLRLLLRRETTRGVARTEANATIRNVAGLIPITVQVPIQIGSDSASTVGSVDTNVSNGI